jgi:di/tripeptidase
MEIIEKDFTITHNGDCWTLHCLKSKKELKADAKESYNTGGYYTNIYNALNAALRWRQDKKYPFKEPIVEFKKAIKEYRIATNTLKELSIKFYESIYEFKKIVFNASRQL